MKCPGTEEALDEVLLQVFAALPCSKGLQAVGPCGSAFWVSLGLQLPK